MRTIYKYALGPGPITEIEMPSEAQVVHVALQNDVPHIWVEIDDTKPRETRRFDIVGTGHPIWQGEHVGTFLVDNGAFVFHVYADPTRTVHPAGAADTHTTGAGA